MHSRLYPAALLALLAAFAFASTATAATPKLGKPAARKAAVKTMNRYLASHGWAKSGKVGKCQRTAKRRVVCRITLSSPKRTCRTNAKVRRTVKRKHKVTRSRLGKLRCSKRVSPRSPSARIMRLAAHLGTPKRHQDNPFKVTYPYSASAASQVQGLTVEGEAEEPAPLPTGVLALYVDGVLECALSTSGAVAGDECPHVYEQLGQHRVTTIYTAGSESAVDTTLHTVEPLPTSATLSVDYQPLTPSAPSGAIDWTLGHLVVGAAVTPEVSGPLSFACRASDGPSCLVPAPTAVIGVEGRQCGASDQRNAEPICLARLEGEGAWRSVSAFEGGSLFLRGTQAPLAAGFEPAVATATVAFSPSVQFPPCDSESTGPWCP